MCWWCCGRTALNLFPIQQSCLIWKWNIHLQFCCTGLLCPQSSGSWGASRWHCWAKTEHLRHFTKKHKQANLNNTDFQWQWQWQHCYYTRKLLRILEIIHADDNLLALPEEILQEPGAGTEDRSITPPTVPVPKVANTAIAFCWGISPLFFLFQATQLSSLRNCHPNRENKYQAFQRLASDSCSPGEWRLA